MSKIDQIDIGKGTPLQRSFSDLPSTFSHVPKSNVLREGNHEQCFSTVCKSSNSQRSLIFVAPAFTALRGIYTVRAVLSSLNFPYLTPVSVPEGVLFTAKGNFQRPHPTLPQGPVGIFQLQFPSPSLLSPTLGATCCSQHSR